MLSMKGKDVVYDICFGGSFFALVDTEKNFGIQGLAGFPNKNSQANAAGS